MSVLESTEHRLLKRQLKKHLPPNFLNQEALNDFVSSVDQAYKEFDLDIKRTENILEQSSRELFIANKELKQIAEDKTIEAKTIAKRLQVVADSISDVIFQLDDKGQFVYLNSAWEQIIGKNISETYNTPFANYICEKDIDRFSAQLLAAYEENKPFVAETYKITTRSGSIRYIKLNASLIDISDNSKKGISGSFSDITQAYLAQREKERLAFVVEKANNMVLVTDIDGKLEWANPAFEKITGYKIGEAMGKKPSDFLQGEKSDPETIEFMAQKLANKESFSCEIINYTKSGREYWIELSVDPIFLDDGTLNGFLAIENEITERKEQEEQLKKSEAKLSAVINNIPDLIFYKNIDGVYEMTNKAFNNFMRVTQSDGRTDYEIHPEQTALKIIEDDTDLIKREATKTLEGEVFFANGDKLVLNTTKTVIKDEYGKVKGLVGISRDITEIKKAKEKEQAYIADLEKINTELDQFAYIVSHDLKAPLRAINNLSTWIEEDLEGKLEDDTEEQFKLLRGRVLRMEGLINGILQYSRAGRVTTSEQEVNVEEMLTEISESLNVGYNGNITLCGKLPLIKTEKVALDQVFSNLISNALKYNDKPKPEISVLCKDLPGFYSFSVEDNGPGISEEFRDRVFVIFQTLQARDQVESTGVGLAIVKKIIEDKGGTISVEDSKLGGAKFSFTWPKEHLNNN